MSTEDAHRRLLLLKADVLSHPLLQPMAILVRRVLFVADIVLDVLVGKQLLESGHPDWAVVCPLAKTSD